MKFRFHREKSGIQGFCYSISKKPSKVFPVGL